MTPADIVDYWLPAVRSIYGLHAVTVETCTELDELLGLDEYHTYKHRDRKYHDKANFIPLPEELKKLLVMLASPHGKTILKMYRIQKGLE